MLLPSPLHRPLAPAALALLLALPTAAQDTVGQTTIGSLKTGGQQPAGLNFPNAHEHALSHDARYMVWSTIAPDVVAGDTNGLEDVFLRDRIQNTTIRASVGDAGQQGNGYCDGCAVSNDGRYVVFTSTSDNLVPGDTNVRKDIFLRDVVAGTTTLVSHTPGGGPGDGHSEFPTISGDGSVVAFESFATDLVPGDTNASTDVFLYDVATGTVTLASAAGGGPANSTSQRPALAADGGWLAFQSAATNLVPGDTNARVDVFVRDLTTGMLHRATPPGAQFDQNCTEPDVSADGRYVAFVTASTNIVSGGNANGFHIARWDRVTGAVDPVSVNVNGNLPVDFCSAPVISDDGAWVGFQSGTATLVPNDTNAKQDVFVRNVPLGWTERVSVRHGGAQIVGSDSRSPTMSGDGRFTGFVCTSFDVVQNDSNSGADVFLRDRGHSSAVAGKEYCFSTTNSSGLAAHTVALGNPRLAAQALTLATAGLPTNQFGFYFMSQSTNFVALFGGSQGNLCLGGPIARLDRNILNSGALGRTSLALSAANFPNGVAFAAGERWNFQYWFRDTVGGTPTSNTSSAVAVYWR